jgi:peptidoglycan/xylan/chitin deacetylase (PgdA/CDA1 family)
MYHYVRPLQNSRYPSIKGRTNQDFKGQLNYLRRHFHICTPIDVFECLKAEQPIPNNWLLLTFDDGFSDHFRYVLPILHEQKLSALFFPPVSVVINRTLLDVHKIHFILAACSDVDRIYQRLITLLAGYGFSAHDIEKLIKNYFHENRFDDSKTVFIKRTLQKGLPLIVRSDLTSQLFLEFVSVDETAFAEELYLSLDECKTMASVDMCFGSHGVNHCWMGEMDALSQEIEITESLAFLRTIHASPSAPLPGLAMCYPYGSYNHETIACLKKYGFTFALTTAVGDAEFSVVNRFNVKRYDTNDFPVAC